MAAPSLPATRPLGKYERLAIERDLRERELARKGHPRGFWFDDAEANRVVHIIEGLCKHHEGEWFGKNLVLAPWQKEHVLKPIFGWKRPNGTRRYRTAWEEIARKNGKSTKCSAVGIVLTGADKEPGAQVAASATKRDQARIVWGGAARMVKASPELKRFLKVYRSSITCEALGSKFEPLSADSNTLDGLNLHGNIVDELHAHTDPRVWSVLLTSMGARRQPLTFAITTAGVYDPESIGWQQHQYATDVLDGTFEDDSLFAYIAAADDGDDPYDPATWWKANPNLGVSVKIETLAELAERARRQASFHNEFLRLHLNRWTAQSERWLDLERWKAAEDPRFNEQELEGRECVGGLDLSLRNDPSALVLVFRRPDDGFDVTCRFWLPESTVADEAAKGRTYWRTWADQGWLSIVPGDTIRHSYIREEIKELSERFQITEWGFDPAHANLLAGELSDDGHTLVEVRQGPLTLSEPSKMLEAMTYSRKVRATGAPGGPNPIMRWMVGNAVAHVNRTGLIQPDKAKARGKIDGVSALVTALSRIVGGESESHVGDDLVIV